MKVLGCKKGGFMSRLAIIYSNNFGEETDVDIYFINRIIGVFDRVIVACGDRIGAEERNKIEAIGGEILVGDNLDAMSMWRYTFKEYLGLDYCKQFEQIMIASLDSFYGVSINETMFVRTVTILPA